MGTGMNNINFDNSQFQQMIQQQTQKDLESLQTSQQNVKGALNTGKNTQATERANAGNVDETRAKNKAQKTSSSSQAQKTKKSSKSSSSSAASGVAGMQKDAISKAELPSIAAVSQSPNHIKDDYSSPSLEAPTTNVDGNSLKSNMGTLALLGLVLTMLAEANGKTWSSDFLEQNQAIQNQVKLAPEIGAAIRAQANEQAAATEAQAKQSLVSGIVNLTSFAAAGILGGIGAASELGGKLGSAVFKEEETATEGEEAGVNAASMATKNLEETATSEGEELENIEQNVSKEAASPNQIEKETSLNTMKNQEKVEQDLSEDIENSSSQEAIDEAINSPGWQEKFFRGLNVLKTQAGRGTEAMMKFLDHSMKVSNLLNMLNQGVDGIAGSIYQTQAAVHQKQAGVYEAQAAELQQMASVDDKLAGQAASLQEQAQSSFSNAMQILQNAADSMTQTSASIFG